QNISEVFSYYLKTFLQDFADYPPRREFAGRQKSERDVRLPNNGGGFNGGNMKQSKLALILLPILLICPALWAVRSQDPPKPEKPAPQQEKSSEIKLAVDLVVLDALVMQQKTSRIVGNLKKEDFSLFEDGTKQQISYFSQDRLPLSVILIVDRAGCLDPFSAEMHRATVEALSKLRPEDEVALMAFAADVELVQPFRYDRQRVIGALDRLPDHDEDQD